MLDTINTEPNTTEGILSIDPIDMNELPTGTLREMLAAGDVVANCHRVLSNTGDNIVGELIKDAGTFYEWQHYPDGDVYDRGTHAQYYYHAHLKEERIGEHGHFHTFLRPKGMPKNVHPSRAVPDYRSPREDNEALSHLIAVSMDRQGSRSGCSLQTAGLPVNSGIGRRTWSEWWNGSKSTMPSRPGP